MSPRTYAIVGVIFCSAGMVAYYELGSRLLLWLADQIGDRAFTIVCVAIFAATVLSGLWVDRRRARAQRGAPPQHRGG